MSTCEAAEPPCAVEQCWLLYGIVGDTFWWAHCYAETQGTPISVTFDAARIIEAEEAGDTSLIGMMHTHPGMRAIPSQQDLNCMGAWADCLGRPLLCLIEGNDGLKGWWVDPNFEDEPQFTECQVEIVGDTIIGTTEWE